jgi:hypothetical protein
MSKRKAIDALGIGPGVGPDGVAARLYIFIFGLRSNNHMDCYCATPLFITDLRPRDFALRRYSSVDAIAPALGSYPKIEIERLPR